MKVETGERTLAAKEGEEVGMCFSEMDGVGPLKRAEVSKKKCRETGVVLAEMSQTVR